MEDNGRTRIIDKVVREGHGLSRSKYKGRHCTNRYFIDVVLSWGMHQAELLGNMTHLNGDIGESLRGTMKLQVRLRKTKNGSDDPPSHLGMKIQREIEFLELGIGCYSCKRNAQEKQ